MRRTTWMLAFLLVVAAGACGGDDERTGEAGGGQEVATAGLEDAFLATAEAPGYRMTQSVGQTISSPALGLDTDIPLDEDSPMIVAEATDEASHLRMDVSALLGPMLGDDAPPIGFEVWTGADRMVIDTRDYAAILELNPDAELGPFEPGVSFVDLEAVGDEDPDLLVAIVGQGVPDPTELAGSLPNALEGLEQRGSSYTGTASYAEFLEAMGSEPEVVARSAAAGVALNLAVDADSVTDFYVEYFAATEVDIAVDTGEDGSVRTLAYDVDLSGLFPALVDHEDELGLDIPADEVDEAREAFAETVWTLEAVVSFEVVDDLQLTPAPETADDRTSEWLAFLREGGF